LRESGLEEPARAALAAGVPFFGVCVGFQLLYEGSVESPGAPGLGVFRGTVTPLPPGVKHPQMQWNTLEARGRGEPAPLRGLGPHPWVYFVHSFAPPVGDETVAVCDYGGPVAALATRGPLWGAQFHPEKSGATGLALLANFVAMAAMAPA
jgi:glutamine amidotransferase